MTRFKTWLAGSLSLSAIAISAPFAHAATLPSVPGLNFQTSAPGRAATIGDWYTTNAGGKIGGYQPHRFFINITPADLAANGGSVAITVNDAESFGTLDEVSGPGDPTRFTLIRPGGATEAQIVPSGTTDGVSITFAPITQPGIYIVTSETGSTPIFGTTTGNLNNDDNGFSITVPGTDVLIGQLQGTFQQDTNTNITVPLFFLVGPGTSSLFLRNFDLDNGGTVTYTRPSGTSIARLASGDGVWNGGGDLNTGQDTIPLTTTITDSIANDFGRWGLTLSNYTSNNQTLFQANSSEGILPIFDQAPRVAGNFLITPNTVCSVPPQPSATPPDSAAPLCSSSSPTTFVDHQFTVTNNFATNDIINLALSGTNPNYTVQLLDSSGNSLTDNDADGVLDTGILTPGQSRNFILRVTPNTGASTPDTTVITGTSFMDRKVRSQANNGVPTPQSVTKTTRVGVTLGNTVFEDINGDGDRDPGEPGIPGVTLTLLDPGADGIFGNGDDSTQTTTTDANGLYSFPGQAGRTYRVTVTTPSGSTLTTPATIAGTPSLNFNFGVRSSVTLGNDVYFDLNNNGSRDSGEPGIPGVALQVFGAGANGILGDGDDVLSGTTTTDAQGNYSFSGLAPGRYRVVLTPPVGLTPAQPTGSFLDSNNLTSGQTQDNLDFGFQGLAIGDDVFVDANNNGTRDAGELGIPGATVTLVNPGVDGILGTPDDGTVATTTTDGNGNYRFQNLPPGNYGVRVTPPSGFTNTTPVFVPLPGLNRSTTTVDFGFRGNNRIGDTVFNDLNNNGTQDANEPGISGVTVTITAAGTDGTFGTGDDVTVDVETTNAQGQYQSIGLPNGTYRVTVTPLAGVTPTTPVSVDRAVSGGQIVTDADFGLRGDGLIGDEIFLDLNRNGQRDPNEPLVPLPGAQLTLTAAGTDGILGTSDDPQIGAPTTVNSGGQYVFSPVTPGNYRVSLSIPGGSGVTLTTPATRDGTLTAGQIDTSRDFGIVGQGRIGNLIFTDTNGNGTPDPGETGVAGVRVILTLPGADGVFGTADDAAIETTTNASGQYVFPDLPDGNYQVSIVPPAGVNLTTPPVLPVTLSAANRTITTANFGLLNSAPGASTLRLVKRITNVTRNGAPIAGFNFSSFVDDPTTQDDNAPAWAAIARPLLGQIRVNGGTQLQSGDEITYTIYYLADGTNPIFNVNLCDQIPTGSIFVLNTNEIQRGNSSPTPGGTVFSPLAPLPSGNACRNQTNPTGSVLFNLGDIPGNDFGFIRFRVRIN